MHTLITVWRMTINLIQGNDLITSNEQVSAILIFNRQPTTIKFFEIRIKGKSIAQWINVYWNNSFVNQTM